MRIFFSYGHDCTDFVARIRADLEAHGHEVWMDCSRIHGGDDWRSEIADGITNSQAVLIFMSAHSLREGGVCLDEISISIACGRHIILPVLMEKGIEDRIPTALRTINYYDFSDWKTLGEADRAQWYASRFQLLLLDLERIDDKQYDRQMAALQVAVRPVFFQNNMLRELKKPYCMREWIDDRIKTWIDRVGNSPLLMLGFPGTGKSCYCVNYFQQHPNVVSLVFCEWGKQSYQNLGQMIRNIAFQIASRITSYRKRLLWILGTYQLSLQSLSAPELFEMLLMEPLAYEIDGDHDPIVIVIDGVNEFSMREQNDLAQLLSENLEKLPRFVHLLITTRPDSAVTRCFPAAEQLVIRMDDKHVRRDIVSFLRQQLLPNLHDFTEEEAVRLVERIGVSCSGSFLLAHLISAGIISGTISPDANRLIPDSISATYYQWLSRIVTGEAFEENYYDAFSILACAREPVSVSLMMRALKWRKPAMASFVRMFRSFLVEEEDPFGERTLTLFHPSFRSWLLREDSLTDYFSVSLADGLELRADAEWAAFSDDSLDPLSLLRLWDHMNEASRKQEIEILRREDRYLQALTGIARRSILRVPLYQYAMDALNLAETLCRSRAEPSSFTCTLLKAGIPYLRACGLFASGDHYGVNGLLSAALDAILENESEEDRMTALYMLGTSCDLLGERDRSVEYFCRLLKLAEEHASERDRIRAITGLAWNNHFTSGKDGAVSIALLSTLRPESGQEAVMCQLIRARLLLSEGKLRDALSFFADALEHADESIWGYDSLAGRNQMLLIESIVACYDNDEFALGVRYGLSLYKHISGRGSLAECYCASWIAMNYLMNGQTEQADSFLSIAERLNDSAGNSSHSQWISMHLLSVRAFFFAETGELSRALVLHERVSEMAGICSDPWVLGDSLFERIRLALSDPERDESGARVLLEELEALAQSCRLPHLLYKTRLARSLLAGCGADLQLIRDTLALADGEKLPSVNTVISLYLCLKNAAPDVDGQERQSLRRAIHRQIDAITGKNPGSSYRELYSIRSILQEVQDGT